MMLGSFREKSSGDFEKKNWSSTYGRKSYGVLKLQCYYVLVEYVKKGHLAFSKFCKFCNSKIQPGQKYPQTSRNSVPERFLMILMIFRLFLTFFAKKKFLVRNSIFGNFSSPNFQLCPNRSESSPIGRKLFPDHRKGIFGVWGPLVGHLVLGPKIWFSEGGRKDYFSEVEIW